MKNLIFSFVFVFLLACSGDNNNNLTQTDFCTLSRILDFELNNQEGMLIFLEGKNKFAIRNYPVSPTIDEVTYYILCKKPTGIETDNMVTFSGKSYKFNEGEGFIPNIGGTKYYFFELTSITQN